MLASPRTSLIRTEVQFEYFKATPFVRGGFFFGALGLGHRSSRLPPSVDLCHPQFMAKRKSRKKQKRVVKSLRRARLIAALVGTVMVSACGYQVYKKPLELLTWLPFSRAKTPHQTWASYADAFERHETDKVPAHLLAAIAQVESSGDFLASPPWTFQFALSPLDVYRPMSSAFGLMQMTDGNFRLANRTCQKNNRWVISKDCERSWSFRWWPSHSIGLTANFLNFQVEQLGLARLSPRLRAKALALTHLCGPNVVPRFLKRKNYPSRCGSHRPAKYVQKVLRYAGLFRRMKGS